jgi:hypothetical protein
MPETLVNRSWLRRPEDVQNARNGSYRLALLQIESAINAIIQLTGFLREHGLRLRNENFKLQFSQLSRDDSGETGSYFQHIPMLICHLGSP